ncbi:beta-2 adrenergic receptor [Hydra vulgaris]|uniref:beta-2 adrenergic receptor n=1 Tax=Hydra vulgaris TaxID=6087 RepID=UPI001F5F3B61|nr:beta-2 adrenergic receptor-like [Hydra vulgaris]
MICWRTKLLVLPNLKIFAILFAVPTIAAIICNFIVVIIITKLKKKPVSKYLLLSLSISDLLVGMILGPITLTQILNISLLSNCTAHFIRGYVIVLLVGSSLSTLAVISYDRYLLLTKLSNYNQYMSKKKGLSLIGFSWVFPGLVPIVRTFSMTLYVVLCIINFTYPIIALGSFYFLLTKKVYKREIEFRQNNRIAPSNDVIQINTLYNNEDNLTKLSVNYFYIKNLKKYKHHVKVAKSATLLFTCYLAFIFPLNIWMILELSNIEYHATSHRIFYLCGIFLMQVNSCINPLIYYVKQKDIKKGFRQIFKFIKVQKSISKKFNMSEAIETTNDFR